MRLARVMVEGPRYIIELMRRHHLGSISFGPGITSTDSRFGQLWVARAVSGVSQPVSVTLGSPFYAVMLSDTSAGAADTLKSPAGQVITLGSFSLTNTVLDSTKIVVPDGVQAVSGDGITFLRMNRSDYQLEITRGAGYSVLLNSVGFMPLAGGDTGGYFGAYGGGAVAAFALAFTNSSPAYASILGRYTRGANVSVSWNGQALP